jgi:hypothetical protein
MVCFAQTRLLPFPHFILGKRHTDLGSRPALKKDKSAEFEAYAEHCLKTLRHVPDRKARLLLREMAAEWLNLAAAVAVKPGAHNGSHGPVFTKQRRQRRRSRDITLRQQPRA